MACGNSCNKKVVEHPKPETHECYNTRCGNGNHAFVIMIVLYILLAIIVGSCIA